MSERHSDTETQLRNIELRLQRVEGRSWVINALGGISIVVIAGFAFWLGSMNNSIARTSDKAEKIYGLVLESKDSLASRTSVIESKLGNIEVRLENIDKKLDALALQRPSKR